MSDGIPYRTFEVEAASIDAARQKLRTMIPSGHVVILEKVLDDGSSRTSTGEALNADDALRDAKTKVPGGATFERHEVVQEPVVETVEVVAWDDAEARQKADVRHPRTIQSVLVKHGGRRGFLGVGRRPNTYTVTAMRLARVSVTFHRLASIRVTTAGSNMIPQMKETFWENGGPIRREELYEQQRAALVGLAAFARRRNAVAMREVESICTAAREVLRDIGEFSRYHGYQRQQVAAEIFGLAGGPESIPLLEDALRLQENHAGCSQYSNRNNTKRLVDAAIQRSIANLRQAAVGSDAGGKM
jgi:hypothetical protein